MLDAPIAVLLGIIEVTKVMIAPPIMEYIIFLLKFIDDSGEVSSNAIVSTSYLFSVSKNIMKRIEYFHVRNGKSMNGFSISNLA